MILNFRPITHSTRLEANEYEEVLEQLIVGITQDDVFRTVFAQVFIGFGQCGAEITHNYYTSAARNGTLRWVLGSDYTEEECLEIVNPVRKWVKSQYKLQKVGRVFLEDMVSRSSATKPAPLSRLSSFQLALMPAPFVTQIKRHRVRGFWFVTTLCGL